MSVDPAEFQMKARETIFCVESDPDSCELLTVAAGISGFDAVTAEDGEQALGILRYTSKSYKAIVLAVFLPKINGFDVCKAIREFDDTTPIFFYSGVAEPEARQRGIEAGANAYFVKPNDFERIFDTIKSLESKVVETWSVAFADDHSHRSDSGVLSTFEFPIGRDPEIDDVIRQSRECLDSTRSFLEYIHRSVDSSNKHLQQMKERLVEYESWHAASDIAASRISRSI
jgi:DNA-binding response OmpR family regulator